MIKNYRGHYYAKAQNLARQLSAAYDGVLADYDLLLMPTLPMKATRLPADNSPIARDRCARSGDNSQHVAVRRHRAIRR